MTDPHTALDVLGGLLGVMEHGPFARLADTGAFLSAEGTSEHEAVRRMLEEERDLVARLADLLIELGGTPSFGVPDPRTANIHYLNLNYLLEGLLSAKQEMADACVQALDGLARWPSAAQLVSSIAETLRKHILILQQLMAQSSPTASGRG
ncbi:MAG: hypothetical protein GY842_02145 [bacterium]|nr:hypothetical protein [bacterium]